MASSPVRIINAKASDSAALAKLQADAFTDEYFDSIFPARDGVGEAYYKRAWDKFVAYSLGNSEGLDKDDVVLKHGLHPQIALVKNDTEDSIVSSIIFWTVPEGVSVTQVTPFERWGPALEGMENSALEEFYNGIISAHAASMGTQKHIFVEVVMTHPDARGKGLCTALMKHVSEAADKLDVPCYLDSDNTAVEFYHRYGYKAVPVSEKADAMTPMKRPRKSEREEKS